MDWAAGTRIRLRGGDWQVVGATTYADCQALHVAPDGPGPTRTFLLPFDRPRRRAAGGFRFVPRRRWAHHVTALLSSSFPAGGLRWCPPHLRLLAYQLEPALAVLRHGALRVLIADDVGLGKTIEAGLIVRELTGADPLARVLILCPAGLRPQWAHELQSWFGIDPLDADSGWIRRMLLCLPRDVSPWSLPGTYLASLDFVKRPEMLRPLEDVRWDLLVIDEAHRATLGSDRRAAVSAIAARAHRVILLTATPHSGSETEFRALCGLGAAPGVPLVLFSRTGPQVGLAPPGLRSRVLAVRRSDGERQAHGLLRAYAARLWHVSRERREPGSALLATLLMKRALSSLAALAATIRRRQALLPAGAGSSPSQLVLPLEDLFPDDAVPDPLLETRGFDEVEDERRQLESIAEAAEAAAGDERKPRVLVRLLERAGEPALIFTEYRDTAEALCARLAASGRPAALLHGGLAPEERRDAVASLTAGRTHLVATDAASEGLNLHHGCRLVVHFELPWTPLRLHQRSGRVNRIGQTRRVHEIALVARESMEALVLAPLLERTRRAGALARTPLLQQLTESEVAAHVLGGIPVDTPPVSLPRDVVAADYGEEARAEAVRLEGIRRLAHSGARGGRHRCVEETGVPVTAMCTRRAVMASGLHFAYSLRLRTGHGSVLAHEIVVLSSGGDVPIARRMGASLVAAVRRVYAALERELSGRARQILAARIEEARARHTTAGQLARLRRLHAQGVLHSTARELVQAGLFDRRALRAHAARARAAAAAEADAGPPAASVMDAVEGAFELRAVLVSFPR